MLLGTILRRLEDEEGAAVALEALGDIVLLADVQAIGAVHDESPGAYASGATRRFAAAASDEDWLALMTAIEHGDDPARITLERMVRWSLARDREALAGPSGGCGGGCTCGEARADHVHPDGTIATAQPQTDGTGTARPVANPSIPFFSQGFRPFFLIAGLWAPLGVVVWMLALAGMPVPDGPLALPQWHAHELLAGFVGATMIGFVLTAIPNWTKGPPYAGAPLVGLFALFLAARLALLPGSPIPIELAAPLALAPVPAALLLVLPALLKAGSPRLFGPLALILLFWTGDLLMLGDAAGWWSASTWPTGQRLMANVALLLVGLIGGRIIPTFTLNALRAAGTPVEVRPFPGVDAAAIVSLLAVVGIDVVLPDSPAAGALAAVAAVLLVLRLSRWHGLQTLGSLILWILHVAYGLVALALALKAAWLLLGADWAVNWLHLQVAGALATMILAVMTRATLGHTGHPLVATAATVAAYGLLLAAVVLRVAGPVVVEDTMLPLVAATVCWVASFTFFLGAYGPMLVGPRVNGGPD